MKNILLTFVLIAVLSGSCKEEENISPVYTQEQLNGTWENIKTDENGCNNQLIIASSSLSEKNICENSSSTINYDSYSFDGKKITASAWGISVIFTIDELTDTKLVVTMSSLGSSERSEYTKI